MNSVPSAENATAWMPHSDSHASAHVGETISPETPAPIPAAAQDGPHQDSPGQLYVHRIRDAAELLSLQSDWNRLAGEIPFRRWEWLSSWWNHFATRRDELLVLAVSDETGEIVGIAPWFMQRSLTRGRVIRFLGSGLACSDYGTILHAPSRQESVVAALADWLNERGPRYTWIELDGVSPGDAVIRQLVKRLQCGGHAVDARLGENCWTIALPDSWEDYLRGLSKSRREKTRQLLRRVLDTERAEIRTADSPASLRKGLDILAALHQKRRQSLGQPGCFSSPSFRRFLDEAAKRFFALGRLRLQWIELDGRPVVAEIDFADDNALYMYQSGIDPDFSQERPGWLGTISSLRHAVERGYRRYDFLRGNEPYKASWRATPEAIVRYRLFPNTVHARLLRTVIQARNAVKRLLAIR